LNHKRLIRFNMFPDGLLEFVFGMLIALAYREGVPIPLWLCRLLVLAGCVAFALSCTFAAEPRTLYWGVPASMVVMGCVFAGNPKSSALWRAGVFLGDCPIPCTSCIRSRSASPAS
jgi:peptidoglycan/LPS O-acetylase OafA/YrhL